MSVDDELERAWAAGVFEATGTATVSSGPMLMLKQATDGDEPDGMLVRFHRAVDGAGAIGGPYREHAPTKADRRPWFQWYARGADADHVIEVLRAYLGSAKLEQWDRVVAEAGDDAPPAARPPKPPKPPKPPRVQW